MSLTDRRTFVHIALASALVPAWAAQARAASGGPGAFSPPPGPMRYRRVLRRDMGGGHTFLTERGFDIRFESAPGGFAVVGQQVSVRVEAPSQLADFARLEERRVETGLFPLELDAGGQIVGGAQASECEQFEAAYRQALAELAQQRLPEPEHAQLRAFVGALHAAGGTVVTELPADLFAPAEGNRADERTVPVPGGQSGQVRVEFAAQTDPSTGLMREARRAVLTVLGEDRRQTLESWSLTPA